MTLHMVFGLDDLQRVRLAEDADPLWELVLSLHQAQARHVPPRFVPWRRQLAERVDDATGAVAVMRELVAPQGDFPDFLTPFPDSADLDAGCEAIARTPPARLAAEVAAVYTHRSAPAWVRRLGAGDRQVLECVVRAVRESYRLLVAPHWQDVRATVLGDRGAKLVHLAKHGVGAVLAGLPGVLGWDGRVLRLQYPEERTVELGGRGLTLLPAHFLWGHPITWLDPHLPPVLVYQATPPDRAEQVRPSRQLMALLGTTRAECLSLLARPRTTAELARLLGIPADSAGRQVAVLRHAGLVGSSTAGAEVRHRCTGLGLELLHVAVPRL